MRKFEEKSETFTEYIAIMDLQERKHLQKNWKGLLVKLVKQKQVHNSAGWPCVGVMCLKRFVFEKQNGFTRCYYFRVMFKKDTAMLFDKNGNSRARNLEGLARSCSMQCYTKSNLTFFNLIAMRDSE